MSLSIPHRSRTALLTALLLAALATAALGYSPNDNAADPQQPATHAEDADPDEYTPHLDGPSAGQLQQLHDHQASLPDADEHRAFAEQIDLDAFRRLAVFDGGRAKIIDTLAAEEINRIYGSSLGRPRWEHPQSGHTYDPVFTYLDLLFNKPFYNEKPIIHVQVRPLLASMVAHLEASERDDYLRRYRVPRTLLADPETERVLHGTTGDLQLANASQQVLRSRNAFDLVGQRLAIVSPAEGSEHWHHLFALYDQQFIDAAGEEVASQLPGVGDDLQVADADAAAQVREQFTALAVAWQNHDADAVNEALDAIVLALPQVNPATYPTQARRNLEYLYNTTHRFTLGFVLYTLAALALLLAFAVGGWRWLAWGGIGLLGAGFLFHSGGLVVRGVLMERWPIHNQFESFFAVAWFAVLLGIVLMLVRRQWLFGAAAAALGGASLMVANLRDIPSSEMGNVPAILATSNILYIHVNVVLISYAMIGLAFFISLFYLGVHYFARDDGSARKAPKDPPASASASAPPAGGALAMAGATPGPTPAAAAPVDGSRDLLQFAAASVASYDTTKAVPTRGKAALLNDLDKAQLIVMQLAFWTLGVGILLGAYWADHAWGRWWAWDPKETWSLITWIIYLIAIHVRFGVRKRGLVTAWLCGLGFLAMLWCYWGVNLFLAGLHSYA